MLIKKTTGGATSNPFPSFVWVIGILALTHLFSCGESDRSGKGSLPAYVGRAGEVLVIMENQYWNGPPGELVRELLTVPVPGLPQDEPMFDLVHYPPEQFDKLIKPHRNILYVDIRDNINYREPKMQVISNKFAQDQIVVNCSAMTAGDFTAAFRNTCHSVIEKINAAELMRLRNYYTVFGEKEPELALRNRGIELIFPDLCKTAENHDEFFWAHKLTARPKDQQMHDVQQGIILYQYPYLDDSTFTRDFLIAKRDSILREWMPGPGVGSYMATETIHDEPIFTESELNGTYAAELRGLWKMQNAVMGGPFISVSIFNEFTGMIITAEAFVFAPKFDKREYLREVEACVKSLKVFATEQTN